MVQNQQSALQLTPQQLQDIKKRLIDKREKLKEELRIKHKEVYQWLLDHHIDLDNLQKYSQNIAAALILTNQLMINPSGLTPIPTPASLVSTPKDQPDLEGLAPEEEAKRVWELYGRIIDEVAQEYGIDPQLIFATIMTESEGNPRAYRYESHINDASYGLGQILYTTALSLGFTGSPEEMYKPEVAIDLIGRYHKNTLETYGPLGPEQMTTVYNCGNLFGYPYPGHLDRFCSWYYTYADPRKLANK